MFFGYQTGNFFYTFFLLHTIRFFFIQYFNKNISKLFKVVNVNLIFLSLYLFRSYTGIGCSLLTYRGYLHLSLIADKALIQSEKALTKILENTVNEIDNLYDRLTLSFFSKKLHRSISTPTKKGMSIERNLIKKY